MQEPLKHSRPCELVASKLQDTELVGIFDYKYLKCFFKSIVVMKTFPFSLVTRACESKDKCDTSMVKKLIGIFYLNSHFSQMWFCFNRIPAAGREGSFFSQKF